MHCWRLRDSAFLTDGMFGYLTTEIEFNIWLVILRHGSDLAKVSYSRKSLLPWSKMLPSLMLVQLVRSDSSKI